MRKIIWIATALFLCLATNISAAPDTLSSQQYQDYTHTFKENPTEEKGARYFLQTSFKNYEYVAVRIGIIPVEGQEGIPVNVSEYDSEDFFSTHKPQGQWSCIISKEDSWQAVSEFLSENVKFLEEGTTIAFSTPQGLSVGEIIFLYHFPRQKLLKIGNLEYVLSEKAQAYFTLSAVSDYPASQNVLIIQEPHYELDRQYALFKGLEVFFSDNPQFLMEDRTVFLTEGYPAGESLSTQPLIQTEPKPSNALIKDILSTFLIPGYVAYEWKHQQGIPIVGIEDPALYKLSADVWSKLQNSKDNSYALLWPKTVYARNHSIARTLFAQLRKHECPILFVGGRHLEPMTADEQLTRGDWKSFKNILSSSDLNYLKQTDERSVVEFLKEKGIGFYFLSARGSPVPDVETEDQAIEQYAKLMRVQLNDNNQENYLRYYGNRGDSVTTSCDTKAAAAVVVAMAGGSGAAVSVVGPGVMGPGAIAPGLLGAGAAGGAALGVQAQPKAKAEPNAASGGNSDGDGDDDGDGGNGGCGWLCKLKNALKNLLKKIGETKKGQGKDIGKQNNTRTPATGEPGTKQEFPDSKGGKTVREYGQDGKATRDTDYGHDHGAGDPHVHDWDWSKDSPRQPGKTP